MGLVSRFPTIPVPLLLALMVTLLLFSGARAQTLLPGTGSDRGDDPPYGFENYPEGPVVIAPGDDGAWRFTADTLARLTPILDGLAARAKVTGEDSAEFLPFHLRQAIPSELKRPGFILELWQWLGILVTIVVGVVADKGTSFVLTLLVRHWKGRFRAEAYRRLDDRILRPLGLMVMAAIWWAGLNLLGLPAGALLVLLVAVKFLASISGVWGAYRLVDLVQVYIIHWRRAGVSPPAPEEPALGPEQDAVLARGRDAARGIVTATTGLDTRPSPVRFT